jgi:hypothetical protein
MFPFTNAQKKVIEEVDTKIPEIIKELEVLHKQLMDAMVDLPHKNEEGVSIVHGSNMQCYRRAQDLESFIRNSWRKWI